MANGLRPAPFGASWPRRASEKSELKVSYAESSDDEKLTSKKPGATRSTSPTIQEHLNAKSSPPSQTSKNATAKTGSPADMEGLEREFRRQLRASAQREVANFDGMEKLVEGEKRYWLVATAPEVPVAGADCMVYFNRQQSEALRNRPRVEIHYGFNRWERGPAEGSAFLDLAPVGLPFYGGGDWWGIKIPIPEDAFEMNFVFGDAEGVYENNGGNDFLLEVAGGLTVEQWEELAIKRAEEAEAARLKAEEEARIAAAKAEEERKEAEDLQKARDYVNEIGWRYNDLRANGLHMLQHGEGPDAKKVWSTVPAVLTSGCKATLRYNSKAGPLHWVDWKEAGAPTLKFGHNYWQNAQDIVMSPAAEKETETECWWEADIMVDKSAVALNFVVNLNDMYDNNNSQDYKVLVDLPKGVPDMEAWQDSLVEVVRGSIFSARRAAEAAHEAKMKARAEKRKIVFDHSCEVARRQLRHVLFTEPATPAAGKDITLYYNPKNTNLAGCEEIYLQGGFNRWAHPVSFGPIKMTPPTEGEHFQATVSVPASAWSLDFVFSNVQQGDGIYDNRGGLDYHLPTEGSTAKEAPMHICHISVEMAPIAKVGGLGDVVTSLGRAMNDLGHYTEIILPKYAFFNHSPLLQNLEYDTEFDWGGTKNYVTKCKVEGIQCFFIEPKNGMFDVGSVYGRDDDAVRFDFFCKAALEFLLQTARQPDIIHTHDWPTAMAAKFYWSDYHHFGLWKPKVVFTIHNMNYGQSRIAEAALNCQKFTTVSPTYAFEIGGHATVAAHNMKLRGIRNGIDPDIWDPETDMFLPLHYNSSNVVEGKRAAKEELRRRLNLSGWEAENKPLVGVVSRLTAQKGVHLIKHTAWRTLDRGGQFVLLGSAPDPKVQADFNATAGSLQGQDAAFYFAFDEPLSHLIYAACDIIVVPSMFEPCGLTQMIAMRYGTVPVVRSTGGLRDTVFDVDADKARAAWEMEGSCDWEADNADATNGFAFDGTDNGALDYALNRAIDTFYNDRAWFHGLQARVMDQDWSWNRPAQEYIELYYQARK